MRLIRGGVEAGAPEERREDVPVTLGVETDGERRPFVLDTAARLRHLYIAGQPGAGKSTAILNLIRHDLAAGTGCCLLDPHGGLVDRVLATAAPESEQLDRIVVVDAADSERPVGIDLLRWRDEHEQDMVVQFFLGLLARLYLAEHQGPMLHQAVRHALLLVMTARRSLAEFPLVFSHPPYLKRLLTQCTDPFVRRYFEQIWNKTSEYHKSEYLAYFTSKFGPFFEDRLMRNILAQAGGGLDFDSVLAERKVVLVNLARGRIGDLNASLLGQILLHLIRRSAMRRDPLSSPSLFNLYIDEAHEFAGGELRELVTAMRKFGVGVTLANQTIDDFYPRVRDTILGSVGTFLVLRQGPHSTLEALTQPRFDCRDLMRLPDFTAVACRTSAEGFVPPRSLRLKSPPKRQDEAQAEAIRRASAARHARPRAEVEAELLRAAEGLDAGESREGKDKASEVQA